MAERTTRKMSTAESLELKALQEAFQLYTRTAQSMEESYRRLEGRLTSLDEELQEKNRELALTTEYLNSILESMTNGVIAIDNEGVITTFNHAAGEILGYESAEVTGHSYVEVFEEPFAAVDKRRETELRGREGGVRVTERTSPVSDRAGNQIGYVKVFQDLREIESLREQVRRKDRLSALGEMAATVAHEIRNPLGGIRGFASLLERDTEQDDPRLRLVQKILAGTSNLDRVVSELLEYTRPIELDATDVRLAGLVDGVVAYIGLGERPIQIENRIAPEYSAVIDKDKMRQVLMNILLNAVQSMPDGGVIGISSEEIEAELTLSISDTGCGISEAELDRVFMPFFTTKEKGTGLGLAVASKIVESHGGRLTVESREGNGSTFRICLPLEE